MSLYPSFARPRNLEQATEILSSLNTGAIIIAGGQEIMPNVNNGMMSPSVYVDIGSIKALKGIKEDDGFIAIGALTVHRQVQNDPMIAQAAPLLAYSAKQIGGGMQVHNRGTIGGNIVSMHPLYDIAPSLLALEAEIEMISQDGVRRVSFADILQDTSHGLGTETVLTRVLIKPMNDGATWEYQKFKNTGGAYGSANCAAIVEMNDDVMTSLRVVLGAASDQIVDASAALQNCVGKNYSADVANFIEETCCGLVTEPLSDHQGDGEWRKAMAGVVARRAVGAAILKNKQQSVA